MIKEWEVEFTIEGKISFFCNTKEEAEKMAHDYVSELCYAPIAVPTAPKLRTYIAIRRKDMNKRQKKKREKLAESKE